MKKQFSIITDFFLFCFLLIILVLPLVVSFNLDPEFFPLQQATVQGVKISQGESFYFEEQISSPTRFFAYDSISEGNTYTVKMKIPKGGYKQDQITIGTFHPTTKESVQFFVNIYGNKQSLKGTHVYVNVNNTRYELSNGDKFEEVSFTVPYNENNLIGLEFASDFEIHYENEIKFELRGV